MQRYVFLIPCPAVGHQYPGISPDSGARPGQVTPDRSSTLSLSIGHDWTKREMARFAWTNLNGLGLLPPSGQTKPTIRLHIPKFPSTAQNCPTFPG